MTCPRPGAERLTRAFDADLFVNLVLGAVVETFSFAFQEYGKVTRITRGDMRGFKRVWSTFDTERKGYLQPRDVPRFLSVRAMSLRSSGTIPDVLPAAPARSI